MEMNVKWSVILADPFGPEILTRLEIKTRFTSCACTFESSPVGC